MILIAVIVGYILGIAPFVALKIIEMKQNKTNGEINKEDEKIQNEIFNEWLNGPTKEINQSDIYKEYITGQETTKGD